MFVLSYVFMFSFEIKKSIAGIWLDLIWVEWKKPDFILSYNSSLALGITLNLQGLCWLFFITGSNPLHCLLCMCEISNNETLIKSFLMMVTEKATWYIYKLFPISQIFWIGFLNTCLHLCYTIYSSLSYKCEFICTGDPWRSLWTRNSTQSTCQEPRHIPFRKGE